MSIALSFRSSIAFIQSIRTLRFYGLTFLRVLLRWKTPQQTYDSTLRAPESFVFQ